jgi:tRNA G10  N-methylase Trm11
LEQILKELCENRNIRGNLSKLRQEIRQQDSAQEVCDWIAGHEQLVLGFLSDEDAKTRKNAALLLGDAGYQPAAAALWEAYQKEETLFVRSAYPSALSHLDARAYLNPVKEKIAELTALCPEEENRKHIAEELRALRGIQISYEGIPGHTFDAHGAETELLLVTNRTHREIVRRDVLCGDAVLHPLGVVVVTKQPEEIWKVRSFREVLFPVHTSPNLLDADPAGAAKTLMESGLLKQIQSLHREAGPFYFRIECKSKMTLEARSAFARKLADTIEQMSGGQLVNSTSDYEIELRLIENREGKFFPCIKCSAFADHRFDYRKNSISASIHPSTAALLMELATPYLKEDAQIMDPFCGVGTMLIERNLRVPAREMYATDIFGEAIEKGRENASLAGAKINFIHRDFFDFKHDYLFDEIVTNMRLRGKKTREEMDALYGAFFQKVLEITGEEATVVMYTNEIGFVKKQLRLRKQFALMQETCIQSKTGFYLLIIGVKKV